MVQRHSFTYPPVSETDADFAGFGQFMTGLSIFTLAIYFITSSDSGSLIVDTLASNGAEEHHWIQRVFWAFTEGAMATGLLVAGGNDALSALQTASIVFGLPFNLFIFFMCSSINKMCKTLEEANATNKHIDHTLLLPDKAWQMPVFGGVFDSVEFILSKIDFLFCVRRAENALPVALFPATAQIIGFLKNLVFPFVSVYSICSSIDPQGEHIKVNLLRTFAYGVIHFVWIALFACGSINGGFTAFGWTAFFLNATILTSLRLNVRGKLGVDGNIVGDFIAGSLLYPQALLQMETQLAYDHLSLEDDTANETTEKIVEMEPLALRKEELVE